MRSLNGAISFLLEVFERFASWSAPVLPIFTLIFGLEAGSPAANHPQRILLFQWSGCFVAETVGLGKLSCSEQTPSKDRWMFMTSDHVSRSEFAFLGK